MKKNPNRWLRRLLSFGLALTVALSPVVAFAAEEEPEEPTPEAIAKAAEPSEPEAVEPAEPETPELTEPAEPAAEEVPAPAAAEEPAPAVEEDAATEPTEEEVVNEEPEAPAQPANGSAVEEETPDVSVSAAEEDAAGTITIGDKTFSADADESSQWSDNKGWKNIGGQYVAMVDYNGSGGTVSADSGTLTLAVAGINRIGTLAGDCDVRIVGSGIVLIDSIEIEDGHGITLHPNTALYEEGSAAVFLKQEDGSYLLINGGTTGILDEEYSLDNIKLVIPKDSSLTLGAAYIRSEIWQENDQWVTDYTYFTKEIPVDVNIYKPEHGGYVDMEGFVGIVTLGTNSSLTVESGGTIKLNEISFSVFTAEAALVVNGVLNVKGDIVGGTVEVCNGGSVTGSGTIQSSTVAWETGGSLSTSLLLDNSALIVNGDFRSVTPPKLKDSFISLKGSSIDVTQLNVSGNSYLGVDTESFGSCTVGNITLSNGSDLAIVCNEHPYIPDQGKEARYVEDCSLTITGKITGGTVSVLAGWVTYSGKNRDVLPSVPSGYSARAYITDGSVDASVYPLNMTDEDAASSTYATSETIPVWEISIWDTLVSTDVLARKWVASGGYLGSVNRKDGSNYANYSLASLLDKYNIGASYGQTQTCTGIEIIYKDFGRMRYFYSSDIAAAAEFSTEDVILIRIIHCIGSGGQGGGAATHVNTSFTGTGVLGGVGAGSMTSGSGSVIYGTVSQEDPQPEDPEPQPEDPDPQPEDPDPQPEPVIDPEEEETATGGATNTGVTVAVVEYVDYVDGLTVTVSTFESKAKELIAGDAAMPQIWELAVTDENGKAANLTGSPVKVTVPFQVPEAWGTPEEVAAEDSLFAVFVDENGKLTAYKAAYDPATGEVQFDAEQNGGFVIVRFAYEDELFTESFYQALAEQEDVQAFRTLLQAEGLFTKEFLEVLAKLQTLPEVLDAI